MSLQGCVSSLQASCNLLDSTLTTLNSGIHDFPRLIHVLQNTKHFELLPESEVLAAQQELRGEIAPQREELLRRAEKALQSLERREYALSSKKELQDVRLQQKPARPASPVHHPTTTTIRDASGAGGVGSEERQERYRLLKSKQDRLAYTLKRLQMEEQGRKTRMSLAPGFGVSDARQ